MATDNPFSLDQVPETDPNAPRRKKLAAFGLSGLVHEPTESDSLQQQPLYGGDVNKSVADTAEEPSQLATERVPRAPYSQEATPLLGEQERVGNVLTGEAEQNTYQPLSQDERSRRIKDFLSPAAGTAASASDVAQDVGGAGTPAGVNAGRAINYAKSANQFGSKIGRSLADLGSYSPSAASSLYDTFINRLPEGISLYGSGAAGAQFPSNLSLSGSGAADIGGMNPAEYTLGAGGGVQSAGNIGGTIGAVTGGIGGGLTLASLINSLVSGDVDTSKTGAIPKAAFGLLSSALPVAQSLIGPAAAGVTGGLGLSGLGLAYTPMLIPAIMDIIKMFGDPNLPYNSGNMSQYRSRAAAEAIPGQLNEYLLGQNNPVSLLGLATGTRPLSPNQEVMMKAGGNPWGTDPYNAMLEGILQGDPQATQDFLRSVEISSGETGGVHNVNAQATDTYRRQLAHALGLAPDQTEGMFGPDTYGGFASKLSNDIESERYKQEMMRGGAVGAGAPGVEESNLQDFYNSIPGYADESYSNFGEYSPYYRDPSMGRISPDQVVGLQSLIQSLMPTTDPYAESLRLAGV